MSKDNSDFFKEKKIWSKVKDELLGCYLVPYFSKIQHTGNPVLYVDCFAGKGKFDDGCSGSPLVALESLEKSISQNHGSRKLPAVSMKFIELNHAEDLVLNIPHRHRECCQVISGKFEDNIIQLLNSELGKTRSLNIFLYVDPYGVKVLNAGLFDDISRTFTTAELLINLNSFGFMREACRVKKVALLEQEDEIFRDLAEYDSSKLSYIEELTEIAGGDYWMNIIDDYSQGRINFNEAEKEFSRQYKNRLRQAYDYVLDLPICLKAGQHPKYRMVHATNHPSGCVLMADSIAKRTDRLVIEIQNKGQLSIMKQTADNEYVDDVLIETLVKKEVDKLTALTPLTEFLANFYNTYGVICGTPNLSSGKSGSALKTLEKNGYIAVQRNPSISEKTGKKTSFWTESANQRVSIKRSL